MYSSIKFNLTCSLCTERMSVLTGRIEKLNEEVEEMVNNSFKEEGWKLKDDDWYCPQCKGEVCK